MDSARETLERMAKIANQLETHGMVVTTEGRIQAALRELVEWHNIDMKIYPTADHVFRMSRLGGKVLAITELEL